MAEYDKNSEQEESFFEEKIENDVIELEDQNQKLEQILQETTSVRLKNFKEWWEEELWNRYVNKTREMDYLQLPLINAYLSEWKDDDGYDQDIIFENCRFCLKTIENLNFAISTYLHATERQRNLWREGIENIKGTIAEKLDYLSFMLLKDAEKHLNPKTHNMEYAVKYQNEDCSIILCLWANLYAAIRKQGMSALGFSFTLPTRIVQKNCAVRIMHTLFDNVSPKKSLLENKIKEDKESLQTYDLEIDDVWEIECKIMEPSELEIEDELDSKDETKGGMESEKEGETNQEKFPADEHSENREARNTNIAVASETVPALQDKMPGTKSKKQKEEKKKNGNLEEKEQRPEAQYAAFDPSLLPPLEEPDLRIVDFDEYFIVGGVFHFECFVVPELNVRKGNITYLHRETPKLRRIWYKRKLVPPRKLEGETPYVVTAYEKLRFHRDLQNAVFVQFQLPKSLIFLSNPEPALLIPEKGGYTKDCIFSIQFEKVSRQISFRTNHFGVFGMLQKKYENFPYKKWLLKGSNTVTLSLFGLKLEMDIQITNEGYTLKFLRPDENLILSKINSTYTAADILIEKLLSVGINIVLGENAEKFANISKKVKSLEDKVYDCMALLCRHISFLSVTKCPSAENEIILEYAFEKGEFRRVMIRDNEVIDYEEELNRIKKANEELERRIELEEFQVENIGAENIREERNIEDDAAKHVEKVEEVIPEAEKGPIFHDLYHYLINQIDQREKHVAINKNACLIENVRILLKLCRPISSS